MTVKEEHSRREEGTGFSERGRERITMEINTPNLNSDHTYLSSAPPSYNLDQAHSKPPHKPPKNDIPLNPK